MHAATHLLLSWHAGNLGVRKSRRDLMLITLAGIAPDLDALGIIPELLTRNSRNPFLWYSDFHHVLGHNLAFGLVVAGAACALGTNRLKTALLALATFHLHLFCDLIGARGPDGDQWPIPYLTPISSGVTLTWEGQRPLNGWPNILITLVALAVVFFCAWKQGSSPIGLISKQADQIFIATLRNRFPMKEHR